MIRYEELMAKTKTPIRKKRAILKTISLAFSILAFLLVFFELALTMHGGWDDVNFGIIFICPFLAAVGLLVAIYNSVKMRSKSHEIIPALAMVGISALFFCYVMIYTLTVVLAKS